MGTYGTKKKEGRSMINHFDCKTKKGLIDEYELDAMSCIKCEEQLKERFINKKLAKQTKKQEIQKKLGEASFNDFPGFLHEIEWKNKKLDHSKNWGKILNENSKYMKKEKMIVVYIKFQKYGKESYATNVGVTTLKSYKSNSLGDLSFSKKSEDGISKRLIKLNNESGNEVDWDSDHIYIIPVCCRRCAYNIEGKLRFDLHLLDT